MKIQHSAHSDEPIRKQAASALVLVYDVPFELLKNSLLIFGQSDHFQLSRTKIFLWCLILLCLGQIFVISWIWEILLSTLNICFWCELSQKEVYNCIAFSFGITQHNSN